MGSRLQRSKGLLISVCVAAGVLAGAANAECSEQSVGLRGDWGQARFAAQIADDPAERAQGLMNVASMPIMSGMLFVYERPQSATFWMRNTLIPLDMLFADEHGVIQHIHQNAQPLDETTIPGGDSVQYVFEINGGLSERLGIEIGTQIQHPSIGNLAAWPCSAN